MSRKHLFAFLAVVAAIATAAADASAYYHPTQGRWMQRDPLSHNAGPNQYLFVHANPLTFVDPSGYIGFKNVEGYVSKTNPEGRAATTTGCDSAYWQISFELDMDEKDKAPGFAIVERRDVYTVKDCTTEEYKENKERLSYQFLPFGANGLATDIWLQNTKDGEPFNQYAFQFYNENTGTGGSRMGDCTFGQVRSKALVKYFPKTEFDPHGKDLGFGPVSKISYVDNGSGGLARTLVPDRPPTVRIGWKEGDDADGPIEVPDQIDTLLKGKAASELTLKFVWRWNCCVKPPTAEVHYSPKARGTMPQRRTKPPAPGEFNN